MRKTLKILNICIVKQVFSNQETLSFLMSKENNILEVRESGFLNMVNRTVRLKNRIHWNLNFTTAG